jgi:hypothetical protein
VAWVNREGSQHREDLSREALRQDGLLGSIKVGPPSERQPSAAQLLDEGAPTLLCRFGKEVSRLANECKLYVGGSAVRSRGAYTGDLLVVNAGNSYAVELVHIRRNDAKEAEAIEEWALAV